MYNKPTREEMTAARDLILERAYSRHLRKLANSDGNIFFISDTYHGVWLEHVYDGIVWSNYMPDDHIVSDNYVRLFIKNRKADGQLPCYVWDDKVGYGQIQECVSFGRLCLEAIDRNPQDKALLADAFTALEEWDNWLCKNRMTLGMGLIEMFCGFDTGHDNSGRLDGLKYPDNMGKNDATIYPEGDDALPIIAPDMNAVFYGDRCALSEMAERLGLADKAAYWAAKAEEVRRKLFEICFDESDLFFYDVDKNGNMRRVRSVSITNVFCERVLDKALGNEVFERHLHNPDEFWTPYPFPADAVNDPTWLPKLTGNSWGYFSQANTALRTLRWMEHYGRGAELEEIMEKWLSVWINERGLLFGQELHPITGKPSTSSPWYSTCMLYTLTAMRRLYGI